MGETTQQDQTAAATTATNTPPASSRLAMRGSGGGEIVEVQGGHIVRATGRKDRHSKVCTAKGPRDRRVRLSAHTAIQFYDVQDRLGYDRPSKAVDWLIKKAKTAIDELAELPAWNPTTAGTSSSQQPPQNQQQQNFSEMLHRHSPVDDPVIASGSRMVTGRIPEQQFHSQQQLGNEDDEGGNNHNNTATKYKYTATAGSGFLQASLDNDIADTIKSFFPVETATTSFHSYPPPPDLLSRTASGGGSRQQDLRLSLQSFQDHHPIMFNHHHHQGHHEPVLFAGTPALSFDVGSSGGWPEQQQQNHHHQNHQQQQQQQEEQEHGRLHRTVAWNVEAADAGNSGHGAGFMFSAPAPAIIPASVFSHGHGQYFSQRGPLQSSNTPSIRAWIDPTSITAASLADHHHYHHYLTPAIHQASVSGAAGFSASGAFSGFRIPARIQGEEEHDGVSDKPSSASSDSHH